MMNLNYYQKDKSVIMENMDSFDIEAILECGQCFRFTKLGEKEYRIIAYNKVLYIHQTKNQVEFYPCTLAEFKQIWVRYFDLDRDYNDIKQRLSEDEVMKKAIDYASGIRILNQQTWECLVSFIISQNNRIPMIKKVIENISQRYGTEIEKGLYTFPDLEQLSKATEEELYECKAGFRAKYIINACQMIKSGEINLSEFKNMSTQQVRDKLMSIKGVGPKIADCVLLFSQGRTEVFPTDVWIKRVMNYFYFKEEVGIKEIHLYAYEKFGDLAGLAQQYLFNYARMGKIG